MGIAGLFGGSSKGSDSGSGSANLERIGSTSNLTTVSSDSNLSSSSSSSVFSNLNSGSDAAAPLENIVNSTSTSTNIEVFKEAHDYVVFNLGKFIQKGFERGYNPNMTSEDFENIKKLMLRAPDPLCSLFSPEELAAYLPKILVD